MLSPYELQRLANIANNQAALKALGLDDPLISKKKKLPTTHYDKKDDDAPSEPSRRSARVAKLRPLNGGLTDAFCLEEEEEMVRPRRPRAQPSKSYSIIQGEEEEARSFAAVQRAAKKRKEFEYAERIRIEKTRIERQYQIQQQWQIQQQNNAFVATYQRPTQPSVNTQGEPSACPDCGGVFIFPKKKGTFRKHRCTRRLHQPYTQPYTQPHAQLSQPHTQPSLYAILPND